MTDGRPDPDQLLAATHRSLLTPGLGRLKVFLGYAPGVGKTYTMLEAARTQRRAGVDVVVGVVVTHGRAETEAHLEGLPALPLRTIDHHGTTLEEFAIESALKRRPQLLLVDELAHTNAPGSRHPKRWQDVMELLDAGIDVYTTLNIQHVESQHEVVLRLTGVDVRERVPNEVLDRATDVELVDLPPVDLLDRLRAGKVYLGEAADRALAGFFTEPTLDGLREIALRQVADRVRSESGNPASGLGKLLVCIGPSPLSAQLLRAARQMAERMQEPWVALHVQTPESVRWSDADRARVAGHLHLADTLGADVHEVSGDRLAESVIAFARRHGVTRIIIGKPLCSPWRDRLFGSVVADVINQSGDIDVYVITGTSSSGRESLTRGPGNRWDWPGMAIASLALGVATGLCWLLAPTLAPVNLCMIYLLAVMLVAFRGRRGPVIAASMGAIALFDVLFIPPFRSLTVADPQYLLTFAAMLMIGLTVSTLVSRLRKQIDEALRQASVSQVLHRVSRDLAMTRGTDALIEIAQTRCRDALGCRVMILINDAPGSGTMAAAVAASLANDADDAGLPPGEMAVAQWVLSHGQPAGPGTDTLPGATAVHIPLIGTHGMVGVMSCLDVPSGFFVETNRKRVIEALAQVIGLAIECDRLTTIAHDARIAADAERLRNTLLSSVSHDLRTPLAAIAGTASTLLTAPFELARQRELLESIAAEADRMSHLVTNLLDIVRLDSGTVTLRKVAVAVEDVIGAARVAVAHRLAGRSLTIDIPPEMPPILVDEVLLQSVLVNLFDNAAKYTPLLSPIAVSARAHARTVTITVADRGPGIATEDMPRIFEKFYRGTASTGLLGAGLGLSICKSIMDAHGGSIAVANRADGGAEFRLTIPLRSGSDD